MPTLSEIFEAQQPFDGANADGNAMRAEGPDGDSPEDITNPQDDDEASSSVDTPIGLDGSDGPLQADPLLGSIYSQNDVDGLSG